MSYRASATIPVEQRDLRPAGAAAIIVDTLDMNIQNVQIAGDRYLLLVANQDFQFLLAYALRIKGVRLKY